MINLLDIRIADVLISGPLQIYVSTYLHGFLKYFMLLTGICNIIYNGHRIYNLIIMYPIFLYIALYKNLPLYVYILLLCDIILGFIYNLYYFLKVYNL